MDQPINKRSEVDLLGHHGNIGPPSMTPDLHVDVLLLGISNTVVKIGIKMRI